MKAGAVMILSRDYLVADVGIASLSAYLKPLFERAEDWPTADDDEFLFGTEVILIGARVKFVI